jgi:predicted nuclease of restriction endonuclease-like (RecB) superfamily
MNENELINAVSTIKAAILRSQSRAIRMISGEELSLYYGIGLYVSDNSRHNVWGTAAIKNISQRLQKELPGLRGFSAENIKKMRTFAEFWRPYLENRSSVTTDLNSKEVSPITIDSFSLQKWSSLTTEIHRDDFLGISFTHHVDILHKTKNIHEVLYYIRQTVLHKWKTRELREALKNDIYKHGEHPLPNNFIETISSPRQALKTISMFKDEYLLDYINVEDIANEYDDVDERIVEKQIVRNIKKFIMTFGRDFAYVGNQYHLEAFKQELFPDLLFFNRELGCLVVVELKIGEFKNAYLGQLFGYLQILDDQIRKPHENPSIGIILCKEANKAYAEYAVRDYSKPMGIATYKTLDDMPETMRKALPDLDKMIEILDNNQDTI